ncbi:MAG: tetratricopeptide repeat protein [Candidatus Krumholzibacteria bacterium]|nr:tetratricopeptide repeat protein [Candidatus Krumholzibacteria bacterium]
MNRFLVASLLTLSLVYVGCAAPYVQAQREFFKGNPQKAEETLNPVYEKEVAKDNKDKNLFLWDMGVYRFFQGDFVNSTDDFHKSVTDVEEIDDAGETVGKMFTSASSQKYVGDPVEISLAYFYLGLSYYMNGNYQNSAIAFRRSIEEDLSKDESRHGDLAVVNFFLGECLKKLGRKTEAVVGYKRAIEFSELFLPAYAALYKLNASAGDILEQKMLGDKIVELGGDEYFASLQSDNDEQGMLVLLMVGKASKVKADAFLGSFRVRQELNYKPHGYSMAINANTSSNKLFLADNLHDDFKDQGGIGDEAKKQATRAVVAKGMSMIPIIGLFAPKTSADIRYWPTLASKYYIAYLPLDAGTYSVSISAFDKKGNRIPEYDLSADDVVVTEAKKTTMIVSSYGSIITR